MTRLVYRSIAASAALALAPAAFAQGQPLRIALFSEPTSVDPHYHDLGPNGALAEHIFDGLVRLDAQNQVLPELAESWSIGDDGAWTFQLRQGVTFSDGSAFDAADVIFSICRLVNNETGTGSFTDVALNMASMETPGPHTLVIRTITPNPLLLQDLADIGVLSEGITEHDGIAFDLDAGCGVTGPWPTVDEFNDGSKAIGTGPYRLVEYDQGASITLEANPEYWGEEPDFTDVVFTPVPSDGPRLAGLLSGDYDMIENPASRDLPRLDANPDLDYVITPSSRVIFLQMDVYRDVADSPGLEAEGENPFKDVRVRRAISMAIDREAIVERIMDGVAKPAFQWLPDGMFGALPSPEPLPYDPEGARALLADAGYPDGFSVTLATPNDRYINDERVAQAIAQFLTRIGIDTQVDAMSRSVFFSRRRERAFSFSMAGWGSSTGEASSFLNAFVTTENPEIDAGGSNYGGFSNPEWDGPFIEAMATMDREARAARLRASVAAALEFMPLIPIHFESTTWAFRNGMRYGGRIDQSTLAQEVERVE